MAMRPPYRFMNSSFYPISSNSEDSKVPSTSSRDFSNKNLRFPGNFSNANIPHSSVPSHSNLHFDPKVFSNPALHRPPTSFEVSKFNSEQLPSSLNINSQFVPRHPPPNISFSISNVDNSSHNVHHYPPPPMHPVRFVPSDVVNAHNREQQSSVTVVKHNSSMQSSGNNTVCVSQSNFAENNQQIITSAPTFALSQQETDFQSRFPLTSNYKSCISDTYRLQSNVMNPLPVISENSLNVSRNTENVMTTTTNTVNSNLQGHNLSIIPDNIERNFTIHPALPISMQVPPPVIHSGIPLYLPPPPVSSKDYSPFVPVNDTASSFFSEKEWKIAEFMTKFTEENKNRKIQVTIPEFRSVLVAGFSISKELLQRKNNMTSLLQKDDNVWMSEMKHISNLKDKLSEICSFVNPPLLSRVMKKLKMIQKKREQKKKTKSNKLSEKIKAVQRRENRNQEIDKWLDDIKEKNMKLKRETEMKKEADYILLEVRKKIHEAKRTVEKIKVFEKLRNVRQANAVKKGLHITSEHNENFERKISILKRTMLKQLIDYEAEEKALKVMLETEQEGQLEEETQWKIKKAKTLQHKEQKYILECLFGNSEDPQPTDVLYLFQKYHTCANSSTENLVQIRHQWDVYLAEDGEYVPQQWVLPTSASDSSWEHYLTSSGSSKN